MIGAILWILRTGAPWRDLPAELGPWQSAYGRFRRWCKDGTWRRLHEALVGRLAAAGAIGTDLWFIDGTCIRAARAAAGARRSSTAWGEPPEPQDHALGRSRGGFGSKLHLVCDRRGTPLAACLSPGQRHDSRSFEFLMQSVRVPLRHGNCRRRPSALCGDKAYSVVWIRGWLRDRHIRAVIPTRVDQRTRRGFDRKAYRERNVVERCVGWLKEARRLATRYEKLASTFLGMVQLAMIHRTLRVHSDVA